MQPSHGDTLGRIVHDSLLVASGWLEGQEYSASFARQADGEVQISAPKVLERPKVVREVQPPNEKRSRHHVQSQSGVSKLSRKSYS
jgi:hypothetical protein